MAASYQNDGCISDPTASQGTGAVCTGIGIGPESAAADENPMSVTAGAMTLSYIGGATFTPVALGSDYGASKNIRAMKASGAVAINAVVSVGWTNRSTRALVANDFVYAVTT